MLEIKNLHAKAGENAILRGLDLTVRKGEVHAIMGPNGSGKSTLAHVLAGRPGYTVTSGEVLYKGKDLLALPPEERAREGVFLAFQYPVEISGVTVGKFLKRAIELRANGTDKSAGHGGGKSTSGGGMNVTAYIKQLREAMDFMEMDQAFINRYLNQGFSGGEKKRMEVLQMPMLKPSLAIMDETDSGLDIDALKVVAKGVNRLRGPDFGALIITHYERILTQIVPDYVHIMYKGKIVTSGGKDLVRTLEEKGYDWVRVQYGIEEEANEGAVASR
jgi:Fe-S cluster assembly ATP-binding protein